jgi:hypothetical protein
MPPGADAHGGAVKGADVRSPPRRVAQRGSSRTVFREGIYSCGPGDQARQRMLPTQPPGALFRARRTDSAVNARWAVLVPVPGRRIAA